MKNLLILLLSLGIVFLIISCDDKAKVKYVAQSSYDALALKYDKLKVKSEKIDKQNRKLKSENEMLKHSLQKYKNGFTSMYK